MKVVAPDGAAMCGRFTSGHGHAPPRPYSFALSRATFDSILLRAAERQGAGVHQGAADEALVWERGTVAGVVVRSGDGPRGTCDASIVVGADGLRSVVARRLGLGRTSPPRRFAFTAHAADVAGVDGVGELHVGTDGYVGLGPIGGGVTTVALVVPVSGVHRRAQDFRADFFAELERYPGLAGRFDRRRIVRDVLATGPFGQWSRRPVADGAPAGSGGSCGRRDRELRPGAPRPRPERPRSTAPVTTHGVDPAQFRQLLGRFATGVTVLTTRDARGQPIGMTASSLASVSLHPPLLLVSVDKGNDMHAEMQTAPRIVLNVLAGDQEAIGRRFAADRADRFDGICF